MINGIVHIFFSSRRRHTRYWRDWSSDVCSTDLLLVEATLGLVAEHPAFQHLLEKLRQLQVRALVFYVLAQVRDHVSKHVEPNRSEERRVGKECRSWWSSYP